MNEEINLGTITQIAEPQPQFRYRDPVIELGIAVKDGLASQSQKIAEHEGKLAGLATAVAALVSFKGFLQAAIIGVGALLLTGIVILINNQSTSSARADKGIDGLSSRMAVVETKMDGLPGQLSREIREASRDMVILSRSSRGELENDGKTRKSD